MIAVITNIMNYQKKKVQAYLQTYTGTSQPRGMHLLVLFQIHHSCILQDTVLFLLSALQLHHVCQNPHHAPPPHVNLKWKIIKHRDRNDKLELEMLSTSCMPYL